MDLNILGEEFSSSTIYILYIPDYFKANYSPLDLTKQITGRQGFSCLIYGLQAVKMIREDIETLYQGGPLFKEESPFFDSIVILFQEYGLDIDHIETSLEGGDVVYSIPKDRIVDLDLQWINN